MAKETFVSPLASVQIIVTGVTTDPGGTTFPTSVSGKFQIVIDDLIGGDFNDGRKALREAIGDMALGSKRDPSGILFDD